MPQTVLITGASSGIGRAAARLFHDRGWNVVATMRRPERETELAGLERVALVRLDVTEPATIDAAVAEALDRFGGLDVVVNNAGYGLVGPFEASTDEQIQRQFDTNVFGLMRVTRAVLPHFRERRAGVVVQVASVGGRLAFPLYSLYHGTKWAVEGFSESLQYELEPFGIRVRIVEPGPIKTDFYGRSMDVMRAEGLDAYDAYVDRAMGVMKQFGENGAPPEDVARVIYDAATDAGSRMRWGVNTMGMLALRRLLPGRLFRGVMKRMAAR